MRESCTSYNIASALKSAVRNTKTTPCRLCAADKNHGPQICSYFYDQAYQGDAADRPFIPLTDPSPSVQRWLDAAAVSENGDVQYQYQGFQAALSRARQNLQ